MTDIVTRLNEYVLSDSGWQDVDALMLEAIKNIEQMRNGLINLTVMDTWPIEPGDYAGRQHVGKLGTYANELLNRSRGIVK